MRQCTVHAEDSRRRGNQADGSCRVCRSAFYTSHRHSCARRLYTRETNPKCYCVGEEADLPQDCMLTFPRKIIVSSKERLGFWKAGKNSKAWFCKLDKGNDAASSRSNRRLRLIQKRDVSRTAHTWRMQPKESNVCECQERRGFLTPG